MAGRGHSNTLTHSIRVQVAAQYMSEHSDPDRRRYVFAYRVILTNEGSLRAKLLSRHWLIRDADGNLEEVRGPGVVGEHPDLAPGEQFSYVSWCPLTTHWGTMEGSYRMILETGEIADVRIGQFFLAESVDPIPQATAGAVAN